MRKKTIKQIVLVGALFLSLGSSQLVKADYLSDLEDKVYQVERELDSLDLTLRLNYLKKLDSSQTQIPQNPIPVSKEYARALKTAFDYKKSDMERKNAERVLESESEKLKDNLKRNFVSDPLEDLEEYDIDNLPKEVLTELNYYALDLNNQIRRQMGLPEVALAQSSIDFADKVSRKVIEADRSAFGWHYVKAINDVAREYGLPTTSKEDELEDFGGQYYENKYSVSDTSKIKTKNDLKRIVRDAYITFMYNGYEFLHAQSIAGVNWSSPHEKEYVGISVYSLKDGICVSIITVDKEKIVKSTKRNFNIKAPLDSTVTNREKTKKYLKDMIVTRENRIKELQKENEKNKNLINIEKQKRDVARREEERKKQEEERKRQSQTKPSQSQTKPSQSQTKPSQSQIKPSQDQTKPQLTPVKNGWKKEGSFWYYYKNNQRVKNTWQDSYYLKSDGTMAFNEWVYDSYYKSWFYLKAAGEYVENQWREIDGSWYYFKSGGYMASDTWQDSYYLKLDGSMAFNEWVYDSYYKSWFYLKAAGEYVDNQWREIDGSWYYFKSGGYMASDTWQDSYYLKSDGSMAFNEWVYDSYYKAWYYLKSDGIYARNEVVQGKYKVNYWGKWI